MIRTQDGVELVNSTFCGNRALSAYTVRAQGGAIMSAYSSVLNITSSSFIDNAAQPRNGVDPLTNSGEGGAVYSQSSKLVVSGPDTEFVSNLARSGQFDQVSSHTCTHPFFACITYTISVTRCMTMLCHYAP